MIEEHRSYYRVDCRATWDCPDGCSGTGPRGSSRSEAMELAHEHGWQQRNGKWFCPAHVEAAEVEAALNG